MPALGAGALVGGGLTAHAVGQGMQSFADMDFPTIQGHLNKMQTGGPENVRPNLNPFTWASQGALKYGPGATATQPDSVVGKTKFPDRVPVMPSGRLKDYNADWGKSNESVQAAMTAPDLYGSQLGYNQTAVNLLNTPVYGKTKALDLMAWARQPDNRWWFHKLMPGGSYWGQGTTQPDGTTRPVTWENPGGTLHHYTEYSGGPEQNMGRSAEHTLREGQGGASATLDNMGAARTEVLQDINMGRVQPGEFKSEVVKRLLGKFAPAHHPWSGNMLPEPGKEGKPAGILGAAVAGLTSAPLTTRKTQATLEKLHDTVENTTRANELSTWQRDRALRGVPTDQFPLQQSATPEVGAPIADQKAVVRGAFGMPDQKAVTDKMQALSGKQQQLLGEHADLKLDPAQQSALLYKNFKDDPTAQLASTAAPAGGIYYPVASPFYRGLAGAMSVPGQVAKAFDKASPVMRYGGLGAAGLGAGYGGYKLYQWYKQRQEAAAAEKKKAKRTLSKAAMHRLLVLAVNGN